MARLLTEQRQPRTSAVTTPYRRKQNRLTVREKQVLFQMCLDKGNKAIAEELNISPYTVKNHVQTILASYEVRTRVGAVIKALLRGDVSILEIGQSYGSNNSTGG